MTPGVTGRRYKIYGMDCAEEVAILRRELDPVVGGADKLAFDILNGIMTVLDPTVSAERIIAAVGRTGMRAELRSDNTRLSEAGAGFWRRKERVVLTATAGLFALAGFALHAWSAGGPAAALGSEGLGVGTTVPASSAILYSLGILAGAWYVLPKAVLAARRLRPDMNLLMTVAMVGAAAIGEWFEAAVVAFLFALSLTLESWSVGRARHAIAALMDLAPPTVRVKRNDGREEELPPDQVSPGTHFYVKPGERIPLDGRVVRGSSSVNQAPITGESVQVPRNVDDAVFAGTINGDGGLEIESTKAAEDTTLARIIRMVGEAQSRRAPSEQWVERFAAVYTPTVLALAVGLLFIPPLLLGGVWADWIYRSLVLLVIACPCALVISTPVSIVAALTAAARNGVLIKGGIHVETPARLKTIALDKTGTLTYGRPVVLQFVCLDEHGEFAALQPMVALESRSDHPVARAVVAYAAERGVRSGEAEEFQVIPGKGATGSFGGKRWWVGSHRYLEERGLETPEIHRRLEELSAAGRTVLLLGDETHVCSLVALADTIRPEAAAAVAALKAAGIGRLVMLTGDNRGTAAAIARQFGVDEVRAELLPADKVAAVEELVTEFGQVAMVGDGVNDAPAMARASLGIAMGAAGSDAAIETADVALMADDLMKLPWLIHHSRRTLAIIRQNIVFSLAVKALFVVLTFAGFASLWAAIAADMGASFLVIFNGLRLLGRTNTGLQAATARGTTLP